MTLNEHVYAVCCRPEEVGGNVIFSENVKTIKGYAVLNFEVARFSSLWDIQKIHFVTAEADIDDSIESENGFA